MALIGSPDDDTREQIAVHLRGLKKGPVARAYRAYQKKFTLQSKFEYGLKAVEETAKFWVVKKALEALALRSPEVKADFAKLTGRIDNSTQALYQSASLIYQVLRIEKNLNSPTYKHWIEDARQLLQFEKIESKSMEHLQGFAMDLFARENASSESKLNRMAPATKSLQ